MKRLFLCTLALVACDGSVTEPATKMAPPIASVVGVCLPTDFFRDGIFLTAALIDPPPTLTTTAVIDATGCDIGIYYTPATTHGVVDQSTVAGARYFGVLNRSARVDVIKSSISNIGDRPFNGVQRGIGVLYTTDLEVPGVPPGSPSTIVNTGPASGSISENSLSLYQKGGITVRGVGASAEVLDNRVTGFGPVAFIAQNGIQISSGATAVVRDNIVSKHDYTPRAFIACGILLFDAAGAKVQENTYFENETNMCNFGKGGGDVSA